MYFQVLSCSCANLAQFLRNFTTRIYLSGYFHAYFHVLSCTVMYFHVLSYMKVYFHAVSCTFMWRMKVSFDLNTKYLASWSGTKIPSISSTSLDANFVCIPYLVPAHILLAPNFPKTGLKRDTKEYVLYFPAVLLLVATLQLAVLPFWVLHRFVLCYAVFSLGL